MERVGYDADTQTYTYQDTDGSYWEGAPGARYGNLTRGMFCSFSGYPELHLRFANTVCKTVSSNYNRTSTDDPESDPLQNTERREGRNHSDMIDDMEKRDWRLFAPFVVLCCVILLLIFRFLKGGPAPGTHLEEGTSCGEHERVYTIRDKDTCYAIAQKYDMSVIELKEINEGINCDALRIDGKICVNSEQ